MADGGSFFGEFFLLDPIYFLLLSELCHNLIDLDNDRLGRLVTGLLRA